MEEGEPVDYNSDLMDCSDIWVTPGGSGLEMILDLPPLMNTSHPPVTFGNDQLEAFSPSELLSFSPLKNSDEVPQVPQAVSDDNPPVVATCPAGVVSVCRDGARMSGGVEGFEEVEGFDKAADAGVASQVKGFCGSSGEAEKRNKQVPDGVDVERESDRPSFVEVGGKGKEGEAVQSKEGHEQRPGSQKKRKTSWVKIKQVGTYAVGEDVEWDSILQMTKLTLVGKVIGRFFARKTVVSWVDRLWKVEIGYSPVVDLLTRGWFAVTFTKEEDLEKILNKSWSLDHSPVLLKKWHPMFDASIERVDLIPIWVRMPALPLQYWNELQLRGIGNMLGTVLDVDLSFLKTHMKQVARVLVSINIREGLAETINLKWGPDVITQILDYENVPFRCRRCHAYGHPISECKIPERNYAGGRKKQAKNDQPFEPVADPGPSNPSASAANSPVAEEGTGVTPSVPVASNMVHSLDIVPAGDETAKAPLNLGTPSYSLNVVFNVFVKHFSVMNRDWVEGLRTLSIEDPSGHFKSLPVITPSDGLVSHLEAVTPGLALIEGPPGEDSIIEEIATPPLPQDESSDSGYFLRSSNKVSIGGLGKVTPPARSKRGRKSNLHKAQCRARMDLVDGKQLSIEKALRAGKGRSRGRR